MALAFDRGDDFDIDKPALTPCPNLDAEFACTIHATLAANGFGGCVQYNCLGAGQRVTQEVFAGQNWRDYPHLMPAMAEAFAAMRVIHRDLELFIAAQKLSLPDSVRADLDAFIALYTPDVAWTPESLDIFAKSGTSTRARAFLRGLRAYL